MTARRVRALLAAIGVGAAFAATSSPARAAVGTVTLGHCSSTNYGFSFELDGAGFDPSMPLEVDITGSEAGAIANPNYVLPPGETALYGAAAPLVADGSFTLPFTSGSGQALPATVTVSTFPLDASGYHPVDDPAYASVRLVSLTVDASTPCTDGTSLAFVLAPPPPPDPSHAGCSAAGRVNGTVSGRAIGLTAQIACTQTAAGLVLERGSIHIEKASLVFDAGARDITGVDFVGYGDVVISGSRLGVPFRLALHDGNRVAATFDYGAASFTLEMPSGNVHVRTI
jgi:hypothetical protein